MAKPKLGSGKRFSELDQMLAAHDKAHGGKIRNPDAVAASIGRKKYGNAKMAQMAAAGRKSKT